MSKIRLGLVLVACCATAASLSGCVQGGGVSVPPGSEDLSACPVTQIAVDNLSEMGEPGCNLTGSSLVVPGASSTLTIPAVGVVFSDGDGTGRETLVVNWGVPGVGVATIDNGRLIQIWASGPDALDLHKQQLAIEGIQPE